VRRLKRNAQSIFSVIKGWNMLNLRLHNQIPEVPPPGM
jgi:hypothetical protein